MSKTKAKVNKVESNRERKWERRRGREGERKNQRERGQAVFKIDDGDDDDGNDDGDDGNDVDDAKAGFEILFDLQPERSIWKSVAVDNDFIVDVVINVAVVVDVHFKPKLARSGWST